MGFNRKDYIRAKLDSSWGRVSKDARGVCKVCGQPLGDFHNDAFCADRWIEEQDAELKEARKP